MGMIQGGLASMLKCLFEYGGLSKHPVAFLSMLLRCGMNVIGALLLEITKSPICSLHAHHPTLETWQVVYLGFNVTWCGWTRRTSPVALLSACMVRALVDMAYQAVMYHNLVLCSRTNGIRYKTKNITRCKDSRLAKGREIRDDSISVTTQLHPTYNSTVRDM